MTPGLTLTLSFLIATILPALAQWSAANPPTTMPAMKLVTQSTTQPSTVNRLPAKLSAGYLYVNGETVAQKSNAWACLQYGGNAYIQNVTVTNGGLIQATGGEVKLVDVGNLAGSPNGGMYMVMGWPSPGVRLKSLTVDNTGSKKVCQGPMAEAAFRGKIDDAEIIGVKFIGYLQKKGSRGSKLRSVATARGGRSFHASLWTHGRTLGCQKVFPIRLRQGAARRHGDVYAMQVRQVDAIAQCLHAQPGVDHVIFKACIDPSGRTFSRED